MTSFLRQRTEEGARLRYTGSNGEPLTKARGKTDRARTEN
jgi:hypothetical protein